MSSSAGDNERETRASGQLLSRVSAGECNFWTDSRLRDCGVLVAFSERTGGVSRAPFASLNLAGHVGDDAEAVDTNRSILLDAVGLAECRERLTMASMKHGEAMAWVDAACAGSGAFVAGGIAPLAGVDAMATSERGVPILACAADCVPIVLVAPGPVVAVVHAGWKGALASLPGKAVTTLATRSRCELRSVIAYVGAHIAGCHYSVGEEVMSQFVNTFGTFARAESGGLDLDAVVTASLQSAGVDSCNIARLGVCTAEAPDRFFSHRAEGGVTGRHAALACIL